MPTVTETFDGILFDMDGTLVDSTQGVIGAWHCFKETYPHLNVEEILSSMSLADFLNDAANV